METFQYFSSRKNTLILTILLVLVLATAGVDFIYSRFHNTSYYISESLLFSSFWFWFIPFLNAQFRLINSAKKLSLKMLLTIIIWATHLVVYPAAIWLFSYLFLSDTFPYSQTFYFAVTEYALKAALVYAFAIPLFLLVKNKIQKKENAHYLNSLTLTENNKTFIIELKDILYFSANSPYINIHLSTKKHLHSETLKGLEQKLDPTKFVRVHKSCIVNMAHVSSYQSRLNGDYDLTLYDGTQLRLSRNYAPVFKEAFKKSHHLGT
jgi:hypothetical protein